jgi:hypothetical protein
MDPVTAAISVRRGPTDIDNTGLGNRFGVFLGKRVVPSGCKIPDGGEFLVVPLPPVLGIPTQTGICNFPLPIP